MDAKLKHTGIRRFIIVALAILMLTLGSLWAGTREFGDGASVPDAPAPAANASLKSETADVSIARGADGGFYYADNSVPMGSVPESEISADGISVADARKIVRTASLTLLTTAYDDDLAAIKALLEGAGGYITDVYERGDTASGEARYATLSTRVPSEGLQAFLAGAEGIGRVAYRSETATDMTVQYADNEARLQTLITKRQRLDELLKKAETTSDLIEIEAAISDTQYEIDSYESRKRTIDRDVQMSEVSITLREETPAQSAAATDKSLGARLSSAFRASLAGIGEFLRNMLVFVVMALPVLIPLAVVVVAIALIRRRAKAGREVENGVPDNTDIKGEEASAREAENTGK